jgi:hypothetical protein
MCRWFEAAVKVAFERFAAPAHVAPSMRAEIAAAELGPEGESPPHAASTEHARSAEANDPHRVRTARRPFIQYAIVTDTLPSVADGPATDVAARPRPGAP